MRTKLPKRKLGRLSRGWLRAARLRLGAQHREHDKADHEVRNPGDAAAQSVRQRGGLTIETETNKAWSKYRREGEKLKPPEACEPKPEKKNKIKALR